MPASKKVVPVEPEVIPTVTLQQRLNNFGSFLKKTAILVAVGGVLAVLLIAYAVVLQVRLHHANAALLRANHQLSEMQKTVSNNPNAAIQQLVDQVGMLMVLPSGEQPAIATVTDLSQLQNQPFFANAMVGDKVLIYQTAKEAILYRPSTNKIVEVAPVGSSDASASATAPTPAATPKSKK